MRTPRTPLKLSGIVKQLKNKKVYNFSLILQQNIIAIFKLRLIIVKKERKLNKYNYKKYK